MLECSCQAAAPSSGLGDQADSPKKRTCSLQPHGNFDAGSRSRDTIVRAVLDASSSSRPLPLPKSAVDPDVESSELAELRATIVSLKCEKAHLMLQNSTLQDRLKKVEEPGFEASLSTEEMWAYYTGLPSKSHFEKLLTYIEPHCIARYKLRTCWEDDSWNEKVWKKVVVEQVEREGKRAWREEVEGRQDLGNYKDRQLVLERADYIANSSGDKTRAGIKGKCEWGEHF